ncbi:FtsX-like permease family protein [Dorea longicatena]|uniref:FtsX-like permease family protein n=1 Tax=Dorea longicatena TaxID=88431 RepID=A0A6L8RZT1_9FIRM|nr:ABC transporter permease [Dorea longicatena]MZK25654.1 FtsX-like permease family protein [Dorea longicatena]MZK33347.1 FtsX-like permease family protein [Dorea longicatena]MZK41809.1 FtsX-like permease family protein [Dorea longicatena]RYT29111.1 ABC transporter permease [Dorea longicatena]
MLGKLAYRNTKRNIKDYLIYLITVTASFSLIFAFNLVASSDEIVKLCSSMDAFKNSLFAVNILIIFVICFLINYTTKFMFEKRSKELGTYMLLGIKKKEIAHLVIIENILLGILAFVLAIPIGFLFSQFVSLVIVNLLGIPKTLFISLNFVSIGLLIIYFLTIYVLVLLNLLRRISKMTIRDFLYFDKQNEKKMFRDSKKRNVIFVLSIILGAISLFLWNSRCTMDNFNKQETLTYLMVSVIMLIISIYGISTTCADMFLTVLLKNKKMKYQNDNLFVARTFASKARTMQHQLVKVDENGEINDESYRVNVRGAEIEQQKAMVAIVVSLFMYIAFILISAVGTILAVQSLSDSTKYKYRYLTLRRLGINDKSLFKTIRKQLLILFCVPAISAILCSFVMMSSLNNVYQQILGDKHLYLMYFGLNLIIFFLIYSIYWIATYIGFKRNINEAS